MADQKVKKISKKEALLLNPYEIDFIAMKDGSIKTVKNVKECNSSNCQVCEKCGKYYKQQKVTTSILRPTTAGNVRSTEFREEEKRILRSPGNLPYLNEMIISNEGRRTYQNVIPPKENKIQYSDREQRREQEQYYRQEYQERRNHNPVRQKDYYYEQEYREVPNEKEQEKQREYYGYQENNIEKNTQFPKQQISSYQKTQKRYVNQPQTSNQQNYYKEEYYSKSEQNYEPNLKPFPSKFNNNNTIPQPQEIPPEQQYYPPNQKLVRPIVDPPYCYSEINLPKESIPAGFITKKQDQEYHEEYIKPIRENKDTKGFEYVKVDYEPNKFYEEKIVYKGGKRPNQTINKEFVEEIRQESGNKFIERGRGENILRPRRNNIYYEEGDECGNNFEDNEYYEVSKNVPFERSQEYVSREFKRRHYDDRDNHNYHEIYGYSAKRKQRGYSSKY